jgi:hypothetical protein
MNPFILASAIGTLAGNKGIKFPYVYFDETPQWSRDPWNRGGHTGNTGDRLTSAQRKARRKRRAADARRRKRKERQRR